MPLFHWDETYLLGVSEIDQQHRELIEMINELYDLFKQGAPLPSLKEVLDILMGHATRHFECEEHWMRETAYPELAEHGNEHRRFRTRVLEVNKLFEENVDISLDLMLLLNNWVRHHLLGTDRKFSHYIVTGQHRAVPMPSHAQLHLDIEKYLRS